MDHLQSKESVDLISSVAESTATKVHKCYREVALAKKVKFDNIRDKSLEYKKRYET